jgi:TFIIF-interacting CTD phosphatase-like protein
MKLLILDLDETLIFSSETKLAHEEDFCVGEFFAYKRPSLDTFIEYVLQHFKLAVWTSSNEIYAQSVVKQIFLEPRRLEFVWSRQRCTWKSDPELGSGYWIKDLKKVRKLGYSLEGILIVDDSPRKFERSYGNYIRVSPFCGDSSDTELEKLESYLHWLKDTPNVRSVDKRHWRNTPTLDACLSHQAPSSIQKT